MNKIILLKSDGSFTSKNDQKLKKSDITKSEFILISSDATSTEFRNYIIIKPSKYLLFDKAVIEYQMCAYYYDSDDTSNSSNYVPIDPIHMEVDSISDLFRCLNCIDKFNVANNISRDTFTFENTELGVLYVGIQLFKDSKVIYNKHYEKKGTSTVAFDSYKITKKFMEIYDGNICNDYFKKNEMLLIHSNNTWEFSSSSGSMINGIPLLQSNTITFLTDDELSSLAFYMRYNCNFYVYFTKVSEVNSVTESILRGDAYHDICNSIEDCMDVYIAISNYFTNTKKHKNYLIDFLTHGRFIIESMMLMYSELYPHDTPLFGKDDEKYSFDAAMCMELYNQRKGTYKNVIMNNHSIMSFSDIIARL